MLTLITAACGTAQVAAPEPTADPLCEAVRSVREAGLTASLTGVTRIGSAELADERASEARAALERFRDAAPANIRGDARRVTRSLERFVTILNDPTSASGVMLEWFGEGPAERDRLIASARRVNMVTQDRCGEPLVDPGALEQHP